MRYFANELGYGDEADFWANVGLLHDVDFEKYPDEHCIKAQEIMRESRLRRAAHPRRGQPRLRPVQRREARARDGKSALRRGRTDRPDQRRGHHAALATAWTIWNCPRSKRNSRTRNSPPAVPATSSARARRCSAGRWTTSSPAPSSPCAKAARSWDRRAGAKAAPVWKTRGGFLCLRQRRLPPAKEPPRGRLASGPAGSSGAAYALPSRRRRSRKNARQRPVFCPARGHISPFVFPNELDKPLCVLYNFEW